jgi:tRNA (pseudouridine54-N1)-methyltransferase
MREFLIVGHEAPTTPDAVSLDDLPGAGRFDVLCRCVTAGLLVSHGVREDARVHVVVGDREDATDADADGEPDGRFTITVDGASVRRLNPDERSTAALLRGALAAREGAIGHRPAESSPGVSIRRMGLETALADLVDGPLVTLHEAGTPVVAATPDPDATFVLSDHRDFGDREAALLAERADARVRLGPTRLHADQAITVAHNWLDTDGYASF